MLILPTLHRPHNLRRFVAAYNATGATLPIHVIFDVKDAYSYDEVETPSHWKRVAAPKDSKLGDIFNLIFKKYPDEPFYGMVADDVVPETHGWDILLRNACMPDKIAWGACGIQNENLPVHPFIGGDLIRKLGWWSAPGLKHWFVDNVWKDLSVSLNCGVYMPEVKMTHLHYLNGRAPNDRTYEEQPDHQRDMEIYLDFKKNRYPWIMERFA